MKCPLELFPTTVLHLSHVENVGLSASSKADAGLRIKRRLSRQYVIRTPAVAWIKTSARVNSRSQDNERGRVFD